MTKYQKRHRIIATFFLLIILPSIVPTELLASNNGPNSFEAANFEPIDAADMVNLVTGDMSYVLPLLNVPSPEGGYPLTLSNHAGIAIDQEASWVGLGWSLNPGSINRNINGYPDDVISGNDSDFAFDQQQSEFYRFGVGANIYGINVGVGSYWGSNKTFGGSVSFGVGPIGGSVETGTNGTGVGLGYAGSAENLASNISTGTSFSSLSKQDNLTSSGTGYSSSSFSFSQDDYKIQTSSNEFGVDAIFSFYYGHNTSKANLFKEQINSYNGILYQNATNNSEKNSDTNKIAIFNDGVTNIIDINDLSKNFLCDNVLLPNYDKYKVQAQGLSGFITPTFTEEIRLKHESVLSEHFEIRKDAFYHDYKFYPNNIYYFNQNYNDYQPYDTSIKLNNKIFFEFENMNSSFLRIDRTNISRDSNKETNNTIDDEYFKAFKYAKTNKTNLFSESLTPDNIPLKNNGRKRVGKIVEAFTNEQILSGDANIKSQFIEAKNLNRNQPLIYRPESIGGYKITDIDGKTYHYSLPVINFEIWYKNYSDINNENLKFIEREFNTPYATDWLLTAITGSDYVDTNGNNKIDSNDYGYWVEFDYGKWSDGYIWNGSSGKYDIVKGNVRNDDRYEYYRGRKQIYYLDAIKTRTHTAYFIKSPRKDALGDKFTDYNVKAPDGVGFDKNTNPTTFSSFRIGEVGYSQVTAKEKETYHMPPPLTNDWISGFRQKLRYADFPVHYSLKLDKIVLVKNDKLLINKGAGSQLFNNNKAYFYENSAFRISSTSFFDDSPYSKKLYESDLNFTNLKEIPLHQSENVIDVNDIANLNINTNAEKIINFQYDEKYALMPNSFHSEALNKGKLTLQNVDFLGKGGVSYMPKYRFNYNSPSTPFNKDDEDGWGYHKNIPAAWSLSQVVTPAGSKINIEYESDDYSALASKASRIFNKGMSYFITKNNTTNELYFEVSKNTDSGDDTINDFTLFSDYFKVNEQIALDMFICRRSKYGGDRREAKLNLDEVMGQVTNVSSNSVTFKIPNSSNYWTLDSQDEGWLLNRRFSLTSVKHSDGSNDGVIMRDAGDRNCWDWRSSYDNDDINFHYRLASSTTPDQAIGGGVRVKTISTSDGINTVSKLNYYYNKIGYGKKKSDPNYKSSGVTSFAPSKEFVILPYASELPPAVVMYSNVSIEQSNGEDKLISRTNYNFETLSAYQNNPNSIYNVGDYFVINKTQNDLLLINNQPLNFSKYNIKSKINNLGRLLSVKNYNSSNQELYTLKNEYLAASDSDGMLGAKQESFMSYFLTYATSLIYNVNSVSKVWYPNRLVKTSVTQGGNTNTTNYQKFDFLTGEVIESITTAGDGQSFMNKIVPAYKKYTEMGTKLDNINYKNMLSQTAANYSYIFDKNDAARPWKETSVGITTWNNIWTYKDISGTSVSVPASAPDNQKVWRKHKSYIWNGTKDPNGISTVYNTVIGSGDDDFDWTIGVGSQPAQWKQISEVTLYDHYSSPLEMKGINNIYASKKKGDYDTKINVSGNARYGEIFYSGAETNNGIWLDPEISVSNISMLNSSLFHTGKKAIEATSTMKLIVSMKNTEHNAGKYKVSVWVEKNNATKAVIKVNNNTIGFLNDNVIAGNWQLKTAYITLTSIASTIEFSSVDASKVYFDDLMIRPVSSSIKGYVYNEWDELTYIIGNNSLATKFEYDAAGRLIKTYIEVIDDPANGITTGGFKIVKTNMYNNRYLN